MKPELTGILVGLGLKLRPVGPCVCKAGVHPSTACGPRAEALSVLRPGAGGGAGLSSRAPPPSPLRLMQLFHTLHSHTGLLSKLH